MKNIKSIDVFVIGNFGYFSNGLDGAIVKTREIYSLFVQKLERNLDFFDTDQLRKSWSSILTIFPKLIRTKNLVYIPGMNNLKFFFPLIYVFSKLMNIKINYFVLGGWLPDFISNNSFHKAKLRKINFIYVETEEMLKKLSFDHTFKNVIWFPNFRIDYKAKIEENQSDVFRMVFMSRIVLEKGIDSIFNFLDYIMNSPVYNKITIDFYGPVYSGIENWFNSQISKHTNTNYLGVVSPESVQSVLCNYDLMLFPTRYKGEGCPGVIIDSYFASLPVLASRWKYNIEFVNDGITGYLFNPDDKDRFKEIVTILSEDRALLNEIRKNARIFAEKFTQENAWTIMNSTMNLK